MSEPTGGTFTIETRYGKYTGTSDPLPYNATEDMTDAAYLQACERALQASQEG